jgi:hypothetical protein
MRSLLVLILVAGSVGAQQSYPSRSSCPVLATLASSKRASGPDGDFIVIWYFNQGSKAIHGAEFHLLMLDTAGNRYPAFQAYQAEGSVKPNSGDVVMYPATEEAKFFGDKWAHIDGVEVYVARLLFADATVWTPGKGVSCKTSFLNDDYDKEMERREKVRQQQNARAKKK